MPSITSNPYLARRPAVLAIAKLLFLALTQLPAVRALPHHVPFLYPSLKKPDGKRTADPSLWLYLGVAAALVLLGGAFAGLTIALMGQDEIYLQVIKTSGEGAEKKHAGKVLTLLNKGKHWVLVTLLLSNVITNETLPIVLDRSLGGGWPAVLGSTVLIVIFGEIVPQSICVRYGLPIGAWMSPFVLGLMYIMAPIAYPTAKLLDYLLGEDHGTVYKKAGLKTLVTLHRSLGAAGEQLNSDEVTIISACLDLKEKSVGDIMTPIDDVFTMPMDTILDEKTMDLILSQGYSRIPIHDPKNEDNFVGMLLVKMLITYDPEDARPVSEFALATLPETRAETSCLDIINFFQQGKSHMVLVSEFPGENQGALGVVTLEDVIEELIGEEIIDESDVFVDVSRAIRRMAPAPKTRAPKGLVVTTTDSSEAAAPENLLVDITENETLSPAQFQRTRTGGGPDIDSASPRAAHAHLTRRHSSTANSENGQVQKRAFTPEMREHLKHLGPANAASKPKHTRMKTITMKPGRSNSQTLDINGTSSARRVSEPLNYQPDKTSPSAADALIPPAGKQAKDGVQLLQSVYGSMDRTPPKSSQSNKAVAAGQEGDLPEPETSPAKHTASTPADDKENHRTPRSTAPDPATSASGPGPNPPQSRASVDSSSSRSTLGSLPGRRARSGSPSVNRGPARSGSITEHYIDAGGVRKIVLETNSSGSSEETDKHGLDGARDSRSASRSSRRKDGTSESTLTPETAGGASRNGSKKKRRRKKGKSGKGGGASEGGSTEAGESQPLLRWT